MRSISNCLESPQRKPGAQLEFKKISHRARAQQEFRSFSFLIFFLAVQAD